MEAAVLSWLPSSTTMISNCSGRDERYVCKPSRVLAIKASSLYAGMMMERSGVVMISWYPSLDGVLQIENQKIVPLNINRVGCEQALFQFWLSFELVKICYKKKVPF